MRALAAAMPADPAEELLAKVRADMAHVSEVMGAGVLVAIWKRPEKTAGGVYLSDRTREEDVFQGKVGLILKMGPLAFVEDDRHKWNGRVPKVGDWVAYRVGDAWPLFIADHPCRIVADVNIKMIVAKPDVIY